MVVEIVEPGCLFTKFLLCYKVRKIDKNRQNTLFLCLKRRIWYPINNCYLLFHINQPGLERQNCVCATKYKRLLEIYTVQRVEMKSVFTFQPMKRPVSST